MEKELCLVSDWNVDEIRNTALKVVGFFGLRFPQFGTENWMYYALKKLSPVIEARGPGPVAFNTKVLEMVYCGPNLRVVDDEIFEEEPKFLLFDQSFNRLLPSQRSDIYVGTQEIVQESADVYKLVPTLKTNEIVLSFPRDQYAKFGIYEVPILVF